MIFFFRTGAKSPCGQSGVQQRDKHLDVLDGRSLRLDLRRQGLGLRLQKYANAYIVVAPAHGLQRSGLSCMELRLRKFDWQSSEKLDAIYIEAPENDRMGLGTGFRRSRGWTTGRQARQYEEVDRRHWSRHSSLQSQNKVKFIAIRFLRSQEGFGNTFFKNIFLYICISIWTYLKKINLNSPQKNIFEEALFKIVF